MGIKPYIHNCVHNKGVIAMPLCQMMCHVIMTCFEKFGENIVREREEHHWKCYGNVMEMGRNVMEMLWKWYGRNHVNMSFPIFWV